MFDKPRIIVQTAEFAKLFGNRPPAVHIASAKASALFRDLLAAGYSVTLFDHAMRADDEEDVSVIGLGESVDLIELKLWLRKWRAEK